MKKNKGQSVSPDYDFDIHHRDSYMYAWIRQYMDETYHTVRRLPKDIGNGPLLDIGIGRGRSLALFKALGITKVVGVDISKSETAFANKQAKRLNIDLQLIIDDPENTHLKKIRSNSYSAIALMNILFCLPDQKTRELLAKEAIRILKPGGRLIILDMQRPSLMATISALTGKKWKFRTKQELRDLFGPLRLLKSNGSNYLYFINAILNIPAKFGGYMFFARANGLLKSLHLPPSTCTFIFTKDEKNQKK